MPCCLATLSMICLRLSPSPVLNTKIFITVTPLIIETFKRLTLMHMRQRWHELWLWTWTKQKRWSVCVSCYNWNRQKRRDILVFSFGSHGPHGELSRARCGLWAGHCAKLIEMNISILCHSSSSFPVLHKVCMFHVPIIIVSLADFRYATSADVVYFAVAGVPAAGFSTQSRLFGWGCGPCFSKWCPTWSAFLGIVLMFLISVVLGLLQTR